MTSQPPAEYRRTETLRLVPDGDYTLPLRAVFPWWFLAGAAVSAVLLLFTDVLGSSPSALIFWGPAIGSVIRERRQHAARLRKDGHQVTRRAVVGPAWLEPALTGAGVLLVIAIGLLVPNLLPFERHGDDRWLLVGVGTVLVGIAVLPLIALVVFRRRSRRPDGQQVEHADDDRDGTPSL